MSNKAVTELLSPVLERLKTLDITDARAAKDTLDNEFPIGGDFGMNARKLAESGIKEGWLCGREGGPSKFSRVAKPDEANGCSIDAVMLWGDGPWHKHTKGEVNLLLNWEGEPEFCGHTQGWAVFPPGSEHVPSVKGGKMMIFYMLPDGAVEWKRPE